MKNSRNFFAIGLLSIAIAALSLLNIENSVSTQSLSLNQLVQKAEASGEIDCVLAPSWCYVGGGVDRYPFDFNF